MLFSCGRDGSTKTSDYETRVRVLEAQMTSQLPLHRPCEASRAPISRALGFSPLELGLHGSHGSNPPVP